MANAGFFMGWSDAKVGREKQAAEMYGVVLARYAALVEEGTFESFEPVMLHRHGGDLNGFVLVRGDREKLAQYRSSAEHAEMVIKLIHCLSGFGVINAYVGDGLADIMKVWMDNAPQ